MSGTFNTCLACSSSADNIFHQLGAAGMTWKDYNQSMPANCAANASSVPYYRDGHNPAYWFTDLGPTSKGGDGSCAKYDVPADPNLWNDIAADALPSFAWIAPDDCRDMHWMNGPCETVTGQTKAQRIAIGDAYIEQVVNAIAATPSYQAGKTLVVVTWDESNEESTQAKGNWGIDCSNPSVYNGQHGHLPGGDDPRLGPHHGRVDEHVLQPLQPDRGLRAQLRPAAARRRERLLGDPGADLLSRRR